MKKYLSLGFCFIAAAILSAGCTKSVRYSPEEIKDYPPHIQEQIEKGEVSLGMTKQQVRYAWGYPSQINILSASEDGKAREGTTGGLRPINTWGLSCASNRFSPSSQ